MSHVVTIKTQVNDAAAVRDACKRLELPAPVQGTVKLFSSEVTGLAVQLPEWVYPIVCDTTAGQIHYDNFNGRWGNSRRLDSFLQAYAVERARAGARKKGHFCTEQTLADGSIKLTVQVAGGAV